MVVPDGEPCGCYENRGCLDSMYCSCECKCCLVQRLVDSNRTCYSCRSNRAAHWIEYEDMDGDETIQKVCIDCHQKHLIFKGILEPIDEEVDTETDDSYSEISEEREHEAPINPFYDERYDGDENENIDPEELEYLWERYWYNMENYADF